jgi:hypothetical protein
LTSSGQSAASFYGSSVGGGLNSISAMANAGFEQNQLGTAAGGPGSVSQDTLLASQGDITAGGQTQAQAQQAVTRAAQTRSAGSAGGGGLAAGQSGVGGIGYGSQ